MGACDSKMIINIINLVIAVFVAVAGVLRLLFGFDQGVVDSIVVGIVCTVAGITMFMVELTEIPMVKEYFLFYFNWIGRGVSVMLVGVLLIGGDTLGIILGALVIVTGIIYCVFWCIRVVEFPSPMCGGA